MFGLFFSFTHVHAGFRSADVYLLLLANMFRLKSFCNNLLLLCRITSTRLCHELICGHSDSWLPAALILKVLHEECPPQMIKLSACLQQQFFIPELTFFPGKAFLRGFSRLTEADGVERSVATSCRSVRADLLQQQHLQISDHKVVGGVMMEADRDGGGNLKPARRVAPRGTRMDCSGRRNRS